MPPLSTVRITELPPLTSGLDLSLTDKLPIYIVSENKTKRVSLSDLNNFFETGGGGGGHAPVEWGGVMIYVVGAGDVGNTAKSIPSLAGKDFDLERGGLPMIPLKPDLSNAATAEYQILDAGGFQLLQSGDVLGLNERFKLTIFSLISGGGGGGGSSTSSFPQGKKVVATNTALDPAGDINKIIQVRGTTNPITVTLPDVGDIAANAIIAIESHINQSKPVTVTTSGGQLIYFNSGSKTTIFLMPGEVVWLFRDDDGFYMINDFADKYKRLAKPEASYKAELNQLVCKGQLVLRADYPRLWEYVQTLGSSFVTDATWSTASVTVGGRTVANPYRGCFSQGDGSTTFRIPDLMNVFLRGVKSETGTDAERHLNKPGGFQDNVNKKFWPGTPTNPSISKADGTNTEIGVDAGVTTNPDIKNAQYIDLTAFSTEARPDNSAVLWVINS